MFLVSSCLAGLEVRYNGTHSLVKRISKLVEENKAVTISPELIGGFSTPREPAKIVGGDGIFWIGRLRWLRNLVKT